MPNPETIEAPEITPIKVEKKKPTGTREMATIARSLDAIHEGMVEFMETISRSEEKENQIAQRLCELTEAIRETGMIDQETKEILQDLDGRVFEERFYTEKGRNGAMRMTDSTKLTHLRAFAAEAAKVSAAKFKMSAGEYTANSIVIAKMQQSLSVFQKALKEHLGPVAGDAVVKEVVGDIVEIWE